MRRTILLLATMAITLLVASGVALAINKIGTDGPDTLRGTNGDDNLLGKGANDVLYALAGMDNLLGAEGKDWLLTGERRALARIIHERLRRLPKGRAINFVPDGPKPDAGGPSSSAPLPCHRS
jgi:Ca2+-binding RTX toxin-like protein